MTKEKIYTIKTQIVFEGKVKVKANLKRHAKYIVAENFSAIIDKCFSNDDAIKDWDISTHSKKTITKFQ